jgi:P-type Cu2+ transporter
MEHNHTEHEHHQEMRHEHHEHHEGMLEDFKKRFFVSIILTIPVLALSPMFQEWFNYTLNVPGAGFIVFGMSSIIFFYGGYPFLKGLYDELRTRTPGMMTLIAVAISAAYFYSTAVVFGLPGSLFFWELATLIDIMLLGHWIEMRSVMGASGALKKLSQMIPDTAHRIMDGRIEEVDTRKLSENDLILVKPGEKIPADGIVVEGVTFVNEAMLSGESLPIEKKDGDSVVGGSINGDGAIEVKVRATGENTYLSKVIKLVEEAQKAKSRTQRLADRAANWLTVSALTVGFGALGVWLMLGESAAFSIERMATVMIIACPHALGLAIPLVVSVSTSAAAKAGLLIRNRTAFEETRKITTVVFDKTGTLTKGNFAVTEIRKLGSYNKEEVLKLAASLERNSEHPIGKSIMQEALGKKLYDVKNFQNIKGKGVQGKIGKDTVKVVSPGYLDEYGIKYPSVRGTTVFVLVNNKLAGLVSLSDEIRKESYEAITMLKDAGYRTWMLTGDNKTVAEDVARQLELDGYFAEVLPDEKQKKIIELQNKGETVAMVGDGVNDAPALAQADIGIAIGSGTDVAAETADVILVSDNPKDIASLINYGKATYNKMVQNLFWAAGYNIVAIPLAAGILYYRGIVISPAVAAIIMTLSTVIVAFNSKLLERTLRR